MSFLNSWTKNHNLRKDETIGDHYGSPIVIKDKV